MTKLAPTQPGAQSAVMPPIQSTVRVAPAVSRLSQSPDPAKIGKAAKDFEAMAIGQLLQPMFDTVDTAHGEFGGGAGEETWKPIMVQEFAKKIAAAGGLGLAKPVYDAMLRMQQAPTKPGEAKQGPTTQSPTTQAPSSQAQTTQVQTTQVQTK